MKLLIISHTAHYQAQSGIYGWGPTVREIDCLAQLFDQVIHLAPLYSEPIPENALPYHANNVEFCFVEPSGGRGIRNKLNVLRSWWVYAMNIRECLDKVDVVHVRCPANISLLAVLLLVTRNAPIYRWIKYAGNWHPAGRETWSYRLQRWLLKRNLHRGVVTINGRWPDQPQHIYTFFNPSLTKDEIATAGELAEEKKLSSPLQLLFAGRIEAAKGVERIIRIARGLLVENIDFQIELVGDGPQRDYYQAVVEKNGLSEAIKFVGWKPRHALENYYTRAHFFLLPSDSEGWPKVLSEAMAYGAVPLASQVSAIPQILGDTGAGLAIPADEPQAYVQAIKDLVKQPEIWKQYSQAGVEAARLFTYQYYLDAVSSLFQHAWGITLDPEILD